MVFRMDKEMAPSMNVRCELSTAAPGASVTNESDVISRSLLCHDIHDIHEFVDFVYTRAFAMECLSMSRCAMSYHSVSAKISC